MNDYSIIFGSSSVSNKLYLLIVNIKSIDPNGKVYTKEPVFNIFHDYQKLFNIYTDKRIQKGNLFSHLKKYVECDNNIPYQSIKLITSERTARYY